MARRRRGGSSSYGDYGFRPYVRVSDRQAAAKRIIAAARKKGIVYRPIAIEGRKIARTPWGVAWCDHCESYGDHANRLPRGRSYVRNGSVIDLSIRTGVIEAKVYGSELYEQRVEIAPCSPATWKRVKTRCSGHVGSLIELLEGRVSGETMAAMIAEEDGILPELSQVALDCSCPDWSRLCKHLAAVLYGVGARLDEEPKLLFTLRGVDPAELVSTEGLAEKVAAGGGSGRRLEGDLSSVFGIDVGDEPAAPHPAAAKPARAKRSSSRATKGGKKRAAPSKNSVVASKKRAAPKRAATKTPARKKVAPAPKRAAPVKKRATRKTAPPRSRAAKVTRREFLESGLPPGTISTWLRQGLLMATADRGTYRHTRESRKRLRDRSR